MKEFIRVENECGNTEQFLQMVLSLSNDLLFRYNLAENTMRYFGGSRELLGLPEIAYDYPASIIDSELVHPDDIEIFLNKMQICEKGLKHPVICV